MNARRLFPGLCLSVLCLAAASPATQAFFNKPLRSGLTTLSRLNGADAGLDFSAAGFAATNPQLCRRWIHWQSWTSLLGRPRIFWTCCGSTRRTSKPRAKS